MSITFPRSFPLTNFRKVALTPIRRQMAGAVESGRDWVVDRGKPTWKGKWTTNPLTWSEWKTWRAWFASMHGSQNYFLGFDPSCAYPAAYLPGGPGSLMRATSGSFLA